MAPIHNIKALLRKHVLQRIAESRVGALSPHDMTHQNMLHRHFLVAMAMAMAVALACHFVSRVVL
jgi:hypothetical protein